MAETIVVKSPATSFDASTGMVAPQVSQKLLGEDIGSAVTPLRMAADGLLYRATAAAANASARIFGWSTRKGKAGQPMAVYGLGAVAKYADETLTPGNIYYLGETAGTLSSIATTGDAVGCVQAIDASNVRITRNI
jgi:hypothetical protein